MKFPSRWVVGLSPLLCLFCLATARPTQAQVPAFTMDNLTALALGNPPFTLGYAFTANSSVSVLGLGIFDDSQDGLSDRYLVGLWDSGGTLLASTVVPNGTSAPLVNQFRYQSISPAALTAGQTYTIGALFASGNDGVLFPGQVTNFASDPSVTFVGSRFVSGGSLTDPTLSVGTDPAYFGPNMLLTGAPVPTPSSLFVLLFGVGAAALRWRKARA